MITTTMPTPSSSTMRIWSSSVLTRRMSRKLPPETMRVVMGRRRTRMMTRRSRRGLRRRRVRRRTADLTGSLRRMKVC